MKDAQRDIQLKKDIRLPNGAHFPIARAIRKHRMFTRTTVGSGMTQVAMMSTSALITHGRTDTSLLALGIAISFGLKVAGPAASGLAGSFSLFLTTMLPIAVTGSGTVTTLWFTKTRTMMGGISPTTHDWARTFTSSFWDAVNALPAG